MLGVLRHALIFGLGPVLQKAAALVLLPLYTHYLTPADYGEIELLMLLTGLLSVVFTLEYRQGYFKQFAAAEGDERRQLFVGSLGLFLLLGALAVLALLVLLPPFCDLMLGRRIGPLYTAILALGLFADIANFILLATAQAQLWSGRMVVLSFCQFVLGTGLSAVLIVAFETGPIGMFAGGAAGSLFLTIALRLNLWQWRGWPRRLDRLVLPIVRYSAPLLAGALIYFGLRQFDRVVVSTMLSLDDLGIYSMSWRLANLTMTFILLPFSRSFDVWRFRFYQDGDRHRDVARLYNALMLLVGGFALVVATFGADVFIYAADPRYAEVTPLLPLLNAAVMLQCAYTAVASAFFVSGRTSAWLAIMAAAAVVQVALSLALVHPLGALGAATAVVAGNLLIYVGAAVYGAPLWRVPYRHAAGIGIVALVTALSFLRLACPDNGPAWAMVYDSALVVGYVVAVLALGLAPLADVREGWQLVAPRIKRRLQALGGLLRPNR